MEGFKKVPKVACFKEGGQVGYKTRKNHSEEKEMSKDIAQDKAMIKKGVAQHEAAKHKGEEKTELKLKSGGRAKKEKGTVKKYKAGGSCYKEGGETKKAIAMKKDAADKKSIAVTKASAAAPKKKAPKTKQMPAPSTGMAPAELPMTEELPAFEDGGNVLSRAARRLKNNLMGTPEQNAEAQARLNRIAQQDSAIGAAERAIQGMGHASPAENLGQAAPMGALSDRERELMNGLRAVGRAMGGKV